MLEVVAAVLVSILAAILAYKYYLRSSWVTFNEELDLKGKVVVITGANSGIGEAAAAEFVRRNARVILACRSRERANESKQRILKETGKDENEVIVKVVDTSNLHSVRDFCFDIQRCEEKVDILINNAGVSQIPFGRTSDNLEVTLATNYFGHFLLTNMLLDWMKKATAGARIVNVSSFYHKSSKFDLECLTPDQIVFQTKLQKISDYQLPGMIYAHSKLLIQMFTNELARRVESSSIVVNSMCPGVVRTNILKDSPTYIKWIAEVLYFFGKTPIEGAQTILYCAIGSEVENKTGRYFINCKDVTKTDSHSMALDKKMCAQLWKISEKLVGLR